MTNLLEDVVLALYDIGAVKFGRFQLASGKISPVYIDLRLLISSPPALEAAAKAYSHILAQLEFDRLAAIPYGGLPIGTAIALEMNRPLIFPRKTAKSYGTGKTIEGTWAVGERAVIIEDLVTTGGSALEGVAVLKAAGLQVQDVVVLIDREQGAAETFVAQGYALHSVVKFSEVLTILEDFGRISSEQRVKTVAALH